MGLIGIVLFILIATVSISAPVISPDNPTNQNLLARHKPPGSRGPQGKFFLLGTDQFGRDLLTLILYGLRFSLIVGFGAVTISWLVGSIIGVVSGYFGGRLDIVLSMLIDVQLSIPYILLAMMIVAFLGTNLINIVTVIAIRGWVDFARVLRGEAMSIRESSYVESAKAIGASQLRILTKHVFPQIIAESIIIATFQIGIAILLESGLGFVGLSIPPPMPTLGGLLSSGREYLTTAWWVSTLPGLAIMSIVLATNITGDGLRDILDPFIK